MPRLPIQSPLKLPGAPTPNARPTVLVTGFDPFDGATQNPSWLAALALDGRLIGQHQVVAWQLPTVFGAALHQLDAGLAAHRPVLVICLGLAASRRAISLERVAINVDDARIPDNAGAQPVDQPVVADGPAAYFSTLPIKAMAQTLKQADIPVEVSQTAGTFVCNHVFYGLMHRLATQATPVPTRGGFVHVPPLAGPTSSSEPSPDGMPLDQLVTGLALAIETALTTLHDLRWGAGTVD